MKLTHLILLPLAALWLTAAPQTAAQAQPKPDTKTAPSANLVDINAATPEQLEALPGVGKVYAAYIIKNRPYRVKNELIDRKVIPAGVYAKIKDKVIAHKQ